MSLGRGEGAVLVLPALTDPSPHLPFDTEKLIPALPSEEVHLMITVVLHSMRYGSPVSREYASLDEAIHAAFWEFANGHATPDRIEHSDGTIDRVEMEDRWKEMGLWERLREQVRSGELPENDPG
jgi:hypothetical protein